MIMGEKERKKCVWCWMGVTDRPKKIAANIFLTTKKDIESLMVNACGFFCVVFLH
jgi:hypothetical protein